MFTLVWQFAQFILLLQAMAFFGVYSLKYVPSHKVCGIFKLVFYVKEKSPQCSSGTMKSTEGFFSPLLPFYNLNSLWQAK